MEDLILSWEEDVNVDDAYLGVKFKMCVMLFWKINDFPACDNLAQYNVKGHKTCHICDSNTCFHQVHFGKKTVYVGRQKFLKFNHPYRRLSKALNRE